MADSKLSALTADTSPTSDDLVYVVNDPGGTPGSKKVTLANAVTKAHGLSDGFQQVASGVMTTKNAADTKTDLSLVKADVGLGNVDNTSDATKNSAVAALTNKDLTSGTNTFPTFNQNTTGSAAKWTNARNLAGNSVDGSADVAFANKFIVQGTTDTGLSAAQFLGSLGTGIVKNTTTTGVLSIAVAGDFPTLNQNTTGSAATLTTPRAIYGNNFDGSAALTQIIASNYGGTGNGFTKFTGPATSEKTFTLPNSNATLLYDGGALGTPSSATLTNATGLPISGLTSSTSTALGVGSIELGHASDTTIARVSAGVISVEGVTVDTISAANTLTNKTISGASNTLSNIGNSSLTNSSLTIGSTSVSLGGTAATVAGLTLTTPTIASFTNATHNHSNAAGGGTFAHANLTSLSADDHTQYALLAGRSGGQTLIGGTASGDDLTLQSTSNSTKGTIFIAQQAGENVGLLGSSGLTGNGNTLFWVANGSTYTGGQTVVSSDLRSSVTFSTTSAGSFTNADLTGLVTTSVDLASVIGVQFQAGVGGSGTTTTNGVGMNGFATTTLGGTTMTTGTSIRAGMGALGGTVSQQYGIDISNQGFLGTVTNGTGIRLPAAGVVASTLKIGLDVEKLTGATTNMGIRNAGATVFTPSAKTITAAGNSISVASTDAETIVRLNNTSGGSITLTSTPTITAGQDGQVLWIYNGSTQNVVFQRESALAGSKLRLGAASRTLGQYDTLCLFYDGTNGYWCEMSYVDNT